MATFGPIRPNGSVVQVLERVRCLHKIETTIWLPLGTLGPLRLLRPVQALGDLGAYPRRFFVLNLLAFGIFRALGDLGVCPKCFFALNIF